ncbi:hypothetical protein GF389_03595 [Candidatus Dojkabacteria bacterium]|nr:hypothetical protein [Candidatus Dojkabacteria bacterium]
MAEVPYPETPHLTNQYRNSFDEQIQNERNYLATVWNNAYFDMRTGEMSPDDYKLVRDGIRKQVQFINTLDHGY